MLAAQPSLRGFDMTQLDAVTDNTGVDELHRLTQLILINNN